MLKASIDLEMNQPSGKIIQIGVVLGDLETGEIKARFSEYVDPGEAIDPFIVTLTGISDETIKLKGQPLHEAYEKLQVFLESHGEYDTTPLAWGAAEWGNDSIVLKQEYERTYGEFVKPQRFVFSSRCHDVKALSQLWAFMNQKKTKGGLSKSMARYRGNGINFKGRAHDALADAENTFLFAWHLCSFFKLQSPLPLWQPKPKAPGKTKFEIGCELSRKVSAALDAMDFKSSLWIDHEGEIWMSTPDRPDPVHLPYKKAGEILRGQRP